MVTISFSSSQAMVKQIPDINPGCDMQKFDKHDVNFAFSTGMPLNINDHY